jgi:hypothetical protein
MIGSVALAAPTTVMPYSFCRAFSRSDTWVVDINTYKNGEEQRLNKFTSSRRSWVMTKRLTATDWKTAYDFWKATKHKSFYFYDPYETSPKFTIDPTMARTIGRYKVCFDGDWDESVDFARFSTFTLRIRELA